MADQEYSPRQMEFRNRLSALLDDYADAIGPQFDGIGDASGHCLSAGWMLLASWSDMADGEDYTVKFDSGIRGVHRRGLLDTAMQMERES